MHDDSNKRCPWNNPETFANPATVGLSCTCSENDSQVKDFRYIGPQDTFLYVPQKTMTGYQAGLMVKFLACAVANGDIEAVFEEVYEETKEHWAKVVE